MLQTKKLKSHVAPLLKVMYYDLEQLIFTWKARGGI